MAEQLQILEKAFHIHNLHIILKSIAQVSEVFIGCFNGGSKVHTANLCISLPRHFVLIRKDHPDILLWLSSDLTCICLQIRDSCAGESFPESKDYQDAHREVLDKAWCGLFAAARRLRVRARGPWTVYPRLQCTKVEAHCHRTGICKVCEVAQGMRMDSSSARWHTLTVKHTHTHNPIESSTSLLKAHAAFLNV